MAHQHSCDKFGELLGGSTIEVSAPCRVDLGGTLDIRTFSTPLRRFNPATFNLAVDLRTYVRVKAYRPGYVKLDANGIGAAEFELARAPFSHPLGLMLAILTTVDADGLEIEIESTSPPRSSLGGSSVAAVALVQALAYLRTQKFGDSPLTPFDMAQLAHNVEEGVARIPCGAQDQLAAAVGGANLWVWGLNGDACGFGHMALLDQARADQLQSKFLLAYCGNPHNSADINLRWVNSFLAGEYRDYWQEMILLTHEFARAVKTMNVPQMVEAMNREVDLRLQITPDVLDEAGHALNKAARSLGCGARFTGAGGGGCIWAVGNDDKIAALKPLWQKITSQYEGAKVLETKIDMQGVRLEQTI